MEVTSSLGQFSDKDLHDQPRSVGHLPIDRWDHITPTIGTVDMGAISLVLPPWNVGKHPDGRNRNHLLSLVVLPDKTG
jgi:hypothetical protein